MCIHRPETDAIGVQTLVHGIEAIAVSSLPPAPLREVFGATAELPEGMATEALEGFPEGMLSRIAGLGEFQ